MKRSANRGGRLPASKSAQVQHSLQQQFLAWRWVVPGASPATDGFPEDIDYGYRPTFYWLPTNPEQFLANLKGATRKRHALRLLSEARLEDGGDYLLADTLSEAERNYVGRIHPTMMGGEYLPDYAAEEVEIARITMASVTQDVVSIRARPERGMVRYRIVDDYDAVYTLPFWRSERPLTLAELIHLIDTTEAYHAGIAIGFLEFKMNEWGEEVEDLIDFLAFSSEFYPDLADHYELAIRAWADSLAEEDV